MEASVWATAACRDSVEHFCDEGLIGVASDWSGMVGIIGAGSGWSGKVGVIGVVSDGLERVGVTRADEERSDMGRYAFDLRPVKHSKADDRKLLSRPERGCLVEVDMI